MTTVITTEKKFFAETVEKVKPQLIIPLHWDNFFSRLDKPVTGMPSLIEKTEVVFFKMARYYEANNIDFIVQIPPYEHRTVNSHNPAS